MKPFNICVARSSVLALCVVGLTGCGGEGGLSDPPAPAAVEAADAPAYDDAFWSHWGDGKSEVAGYSLASPRYGELRPGIAVTIFVTEHFSNTLRAKAEPGKHPEADVFPVMKLNLIQDFQTGIYNYKTMLSSFVALAPVNDRPAGSATKLSYSSQEWCGHTYQQALFDSRQVRVSLHSYFEGEGEQRSELHYPEEGLSEDALLFWVRGLAGPVLAPGETRSVPMLRSLQAARETHTPLAWGTAVLSRLEATHRLSVPAGDFETEMWVADLGGGVKRTFYVEKELPHRIVRWMSSSGERAELLGVDRLKYWELNHKGGEEALLKLGLMPRPPRST